MKKICKKCKKEFISKNKKEEFCPKCRKLKILLKDNMNKVHFFKDIY